MPRLRPLFRGAVLVALLATMAIPPVWGQTASNASVVVASVETGEIMGANAIDSTISANLAGRIGLSILAHEWVAQAHTPNRDALLEGGDADLTIGAALDRMLDDGRPGEMARALMAARIGYTPLLLDSALHSLFEEAGVETQSLVVQRGAWGGPEWAGTISPRDTARLAIALARIEGADAGPLLAGSGLQCVAIQTGDKTSERWVAVVSGAVSPEGCLSAAQSSVGLTDTRVAEAERIDPVQSAAHKAASIAATQALGLPQAQ